MALFGRYKSLLGLDIGSSSVKAVELTRSGQSLIITGMGWADIESPEALRDTVEGVLRTANIKAKRCVSAVSGRSVIFRQVPMMKIPDTELRQAVEYEADKYIPFDVSEVQLDAQRLDDGGTDAAGQMKVLLVAVKKAQIEEHIALLESVGLKPAIIDVDVFALGNAFELRNLSLGIMDNEVRALVDIGAGKTNINIMRGNLSCFPREIYVAGNDLTEAVAKRFGEDPRDVEKMKKEPGGALESMQDAMLPVLEDIGSEIRLSFDYFENQYEQKVKEVYLSGGSAFFPGLDTMLTQVFNLPVRLWDPTEGLEIRNYNAAGMGGTNSNLAIALGLSARLLSSAGYAPQTTTVTVPAGAPGAAPAVTPAARAAVAHAEAQKAWTTGLGVGVAACAAVAVAAAFANRPGYQKAWVILEGLPLGLAAGFGMWYGLKALRPLPGRGAIVMGALFSTLLCCAGLFGLRVGMNGSVQTALVPPSTRQVKAEGASRNAKFFSDLPTAPADIANSAVFSRPSQKLADVDEISACIWIAAHWLLSAGLGMLVVWMGLNRLARAEALSQLQRVASASGT